MLDGGSDRRDTPALGSPALTGQPNRLPQSVVGRFTKRRSAGE